MTRQGNITYHCSPGLAESTQWRIEVYEDGSSLWENTLIARNLPASVDVQIDIFVGGVTFEDMTTEKWITSTNLNAVGEYMFRMLREEGVSGGACHTIKAYQDGTLLGEAYYSGNLIPDE